MKTSHVCNTSLDGDGASQRLLLWPALGSCCGEDEGAPLCALTRAAPCFQQWSFCGCLWAWRRQLTLNLSSVLQAECKERLFTNEKIISYLDKWDMKWLWQAVIAVEAVLPFAVYTRFKMHEVGELVGKTSSNGFKCIFSSSSLIQMFLSFNVVLPESRVLFTKPFSGKGYTWKRLKNRSHLLGWFLAFF